MDKFIMKPIKQKKRRTRRNLDEIRKRTLQVPGNNYNKTICKLANPKITSCIMNNCLTLANKAIWSETVTRPLLLNKDKEKKIIVLANREQAINTVVTNLNYNKNTIPFKVNSKLKSPFSNCTEIHNQKTPDSLILFSSSESEKIINNITINGVLSDSSNSSALSFEMYNENSLYSEFMKNIVNYVQEFPSDFLKTDTVLQANFLQHVICSRNKNIPNFQTRMNKNDIQTKLTTTDHNDIKIQYSLEHPWNVPSPIFQQSHVVNFQKCMSSSSTIVGKDSPEYTYYPHRLNH